MVDTRQLNTGPCKRGYSRYSHSLIMAEIVASLTVDRKCSPTAVHPTWELQSRLGLALDRLRHDMLLVKKAFEN